MPSSHLATILGSFRGAPVGPLPNANNWSTIEDRIGRSIPDDFRAIVDHTGGASMGHCHVRNPSVNDNIYIAFSHAALVREQILNGEMVEEQLGLLMYPESAGLIQIARMDRVFFMLPPEGDNVLVVD